MTATAISPAVTIEEVIAVIARRMFPFWRLPFLLPWCTPASFIVLCVGKLSGSVDGTTPVLPVVWVTCKDPSAECWLVVYDEALNNYRSLFTDSPKNLHEKGKNFTVPSLGVGNRELKHAAFLSHGRQSKASSFRVKLAFTPHHLYCYETFLSGND